jgi:hypothetical protein
MTNRENGAGHRSSFFSVFIYRGNVPCWNTRCFCRSFFHFQEFERVDQRCRPRCVWYILSFEKHYSNNTSHSNSNISRNSTSGSSNIRSSSSSSSNNNNNNSDSNSTSSSNISRRSNVQQQQQQQQYIAATRAVCMV